MLFDVFDAFTIVSMQRPFPKDVDEQRVHALFAVYGRCVSLLQLASTWHLVAYCQQPPMPQNHKNKTQVSAKQSAAEGLCLHRI